MGKEIHVSKDYRKQLAKITRNIDKLEAKAEKIGKKAAHQLMNEARVLLGKSPKKFGSAKSSARKSKISKGTGPTFGGKKVTGK